MAASQLGEKARSITAFLHRDESIPGGCGLHPGSDRRRQAPAGSPSSISVQVKTGESASRYDSGIAGLAEQPHDGKASSHRPHNQSSQIAGHLPLLGLDLGALPLHIDHRVGEQRRRPELLQRAPRAPRQRSGRHAQHPRSEIRANSTGPARGSLRESSAGGMSRASSRPPRSPPPSGPAPPPPRTSASLLQLRIVLDSRRLGPPPSVRARRSELCSNDLRRKQSPMLAPIGVRCCTQPAARGTKPSQQNTPPPSNGLPPAF